MISLPIDVPVVSEPLIWRGADQEPLGPFLTDTKQGLPLCQIKYMLSVFDDVELWSIHNACLSMFDWVVVTVESNVQVAPWSVDLKVRITRSVVVMMPIVTVQAVPSEVQSMVGSPCRASPVN